MRHERPIRGRPPDHLCAVEGSKDEQGVWGAVPSRAVLWQRNQLALSLLSHRRPTPETWEEVRRVLSGDRDSQFQLSKEIG